MKWCILATICTVLLTTDRASAQPQVGPSTQRPAFSPYLNLLRGGGSPALNYYGIVRPQVQARQSIQNLQGAVDANQQAIGNIESGISELPVTGHQAGFLNHGGYFMTGGAGQVGNLGGSGRSNTSQARSPGQSGGTGTLGTTSSPRRR